MAKHPASDRTGSPPDPPHATLIEISVVPDNDPGPAGHGTGTGKLTRRRAPVVIVLASVILGAAAVVLVGASGRPSQEVSRMARNSGPAGVAAAYGHPLGCLSVTILATDRAYARADFNETSRCGRYTWFPTAIFHRVAGAWRPVLDAVQYICPVNSLPPSVQAQLGVCEAPTEDTLAVGQAQRYMFLDDQPGSR
jgi:hypothetical protein